MLGCAQPPAGNGSGNGGESFDREIVVEGFEFAYSPETISVEKGEKVKIVFRNTGRVGHNLVIDEFGVSTNIISSQAEETVFFTASEEGDYAFYCSVPGHREQGMKGTLTVS